MKKILRENMFSQAGPIGPVVMVTCVDAQDNANIITLGMFMSISHTPWLICIGVSPTRFSHDIIVSSGEFVINVPSIDLEEEMRFCGTQSGRDRDKFAEAKLTPLPAKTVTPPLIKECFGHLECRVVQTHVCGDHTLFVGEILAASVDEDVLTADHLDPLKAKPILQKNHIYYTLLNRK